MRLSLATSRTTGTDDILNEHFATFLDEKYAGCAEDEHPNHDAHAVFERGHWIMRCRGCNGEWTVRDGEGGELEFVRRMRYAYEGAVDQADLDDFVEELVELAATDKIDEVASRLGDEAEFFHESWPAVVAWSTLRLAEELSKRGPLSRQLDMLFGRLRHRIEWRTD